MQITRREVDGHALEANVHPIAALGTGTGPETRIGQSRTPTDGQRISRILVVEDSPTQAFQLQCILQAEGYEVEAAPDGEKGLALFNAAGFDLVLSDILMPGLSGYELCSKIKADAAKGKVPVILLTSLTDPMDIVQGLECGADNFITKPYGEGYLLSRVKAILDNKALRTAGNLKMGAEVVLLGKKLTITSDKEQILDLLISTFEDAVRTNRELRAREKELAEAKGQLDRYARRLEGQVRSTEDKYKRLLEQANDAIFILDPLGKVLEVNRGAEELIGLPAAEIIGRSNEQFVPDEELEFERMQLQKIMADGFVRRDNAQVKRADGRVVHVDYSASVVEIDGGRVILAIVHDITERKRAEDAIAKNNERLRILQQIDRALIAVQGPEAIAAAALPPLRELLGVSRAIVNLFDLAAGEVVWLAAAGRRRVRVGPGVRYSIRFMGDVEALRRGEPQLIDVHALPPGPEVDALIASGVHTYVVVPMIAGGELIGALSFGGASSPFSTEQISIAQEAATQLAIALMQARLHERVKRQEQELRSAFEDTNVAMVLTDISHRFVRVNAAFARMLGYSREEMLGMSMPDVTHPGDVAESCAQRELLKAGKISHFQIEKRYLHKDGRVLWGLANVSLVRDGDEQPLQYVGQVQDITEQKQTEGTLRAAQRRLQHVVASSPAVLYTLAAECETLLPVWVSENIKEMLGYAVPETLEPGWWDKHVHPEDLEWVNTRMREQLLAQGRATTEYRFRHADGSYRRIRSENRLLRGAEGKPAEVVGSWSDITEHKQLEEQYRQAQKMEAVGQLAGGVAHDFNNLLTVISGYSELLLSRLPATDPASGLLQEIHKAGERAAGLTRQLLAFSRKQIIQPKVLDLNALVNDVGKMLRRMIGEDISLATVLAPRLGRVKADPGQLEQVLMNLAVNARDAMPQGGKLTIETASAELDRNSSQWRPEIQPGHYVLVAVSDTGCGMTAEIQAHIFEPFFTTKEPGKGTGLGLATAYGIVKQSGGYIYVCSEPGHGTTFNIYLPLVEDGMPSGKPHADPKPMPHGSETILLVEDEDAVRSLTRYTLQMQGYTVLEAKGGEEALRAAEQHRDGIHLLLTDVVMPRMGGREVAERLIQANPGLKVLFLSGYTDDAIVRHGIREGEVAFLQKPFMPSALAQKVRMVLDQQSGAGRTAH